MSTLSLWIVKMSLRTHRTDHYRRSTVSLLIDTGSSNTWVGSRPLQNPFLPSLGSTGLPENIVVSASLADTFMLC